MVKLEGTFSFPGGSVYINKFPQYTQQDEMDPFLVLSIGLISHGKVLSVQCDLLSLY